jgi:hypothetical protein
MDQPDKNFKFELHPDDLPENQSLRHIFESNKEEAVRALRGLSKITALIRDSEIVDDGDVVANGLRQALRRARALCNHLETMECLKRIVARIYV